jgi:tRNA(Arg) A34 adenosine deaminase TadA
MNNEHSNYLQRCIELATEALDAGDAPFGSILVDAKGKVLREDRNRVNSVCETYHPEIELARWASKNLSLEQRQHTTMYTSGEHCPMCSAAHGWAGLGKIIFIHSTEQLVDWHKEFGKPASPVNQLPITSILAAPLVRGPIDELVPQMYELHKRASEKYSVSE